MDRDILYVVDYGQLKIVKKKEKEKKITVLCEIIVYTSPDITAETIFC